MATRPPWLNTEEYPFPSRYFNLPNARQHYIDVGQGEVVLFVHGTPSWSFDVRNVIKALLATHRCVAIDHVGFGLSDKPRDYDYSTPLHARVLEQFIEHMQLKNITLVLHDFGGPIGLDYALKHSGNVKRLVIMNSWIGSTATDPEFIRFSKILKSPVLPFLYLYLNFSPRFLLPQSFGEKKLSGKILKQFTAPFQNKDQRYGVLAFARSLLHDQNWFEELWKRREALVSVPLLLIWGMRDKFVTPKHLQKFKDGFPHARIEQLESCGHFPQEEEPEKVVDTVRKFLKA